MSCGGTTSTAEFMAIVAELGGDAAVDLLEDWLYNPAVPSTLGDPTLSRPAG